MFDAHYKSVQAIHFTTDDDQILTGGADSAIHIWSLSEYIDFIRMV